MANGFLRFFTIHCISKSAILPFFSLVFIISCQKEKCDIISDNEVFINDSLIGILDVSYGESKFNTVDVFYRPDSNKGVSNLMFYIHGGNWCFGDKKELKLEQVDALVSYGYVVCRLNYRLSPYPLQLGVLDRIKNPDQISDLAQAISFLCKKGGFYDSEKSSIVLVGHSAGAHLAALVAADKKNLFNDVSQNISFNKLILIDAGGYMTNSDVYVQSDYYPFFKNAAGDNAEKIDAFVPSYRFKSADEKEPSILLLFSNEPYRISSNLDFYKLMKSKGYEVNCFQLGNLSHGEMQKEFPFYDQFSQSEINFIFRCQ